MSHQETLKSMLQDIINGREEQASVTMHDYFVAKTREVSGLAEETLSEDEVDAILESASEEELDEAIQAGRYLDRDGAGSSADNGTFTLPRTNKERADLAHSIKKNRKINRDPKQSGATRDAARLEREPGETAGDFMKRKQEILKGRSGAQSASHPEWSAAARNRPE